MRNLQPMHKFYGILALVLLVLSVIVKAAPGSEILALASFVGLSTVPLCLLALGRTRLRRPIVHWFIIVIMWLIGGGILNRVYSYDQPVLVIAIAILPSMAVITDLVLNDEIGRPSRKRFRALLQIAQAEIGLSLIALLALGLIYNVAERLGPTQYSIMVLALVGMLYSLYTTERSRDSIRAIAPLLLAAAWNIAVSFHEFLVTGSGWFATMLLAFGFISTAYKLGRAPLPDDWSESNVTIERPTQGLKRTPAGGA